MDLNQIQTGSEAVDPALLAELALASPQKILVYACHGDNTYRAEISAQDIASQLKDGAPPPVCRVLAGKLQQPIGRGSHVLAKPWKHGPSRSQAQMGTAILILLCLQI